MSDYFWLKTGDEIVLGVEVCYKVVFQVGVRADGGMVGCQVKIDRD
jgi:hypothetical protein